MPKVQSTTTIPDNCLSYIAILLFTGLVIKRSDFTFTADMNVLPDILNMKKIQEVLLLKIDVLPVSVVVFFLVHFATELNKNLR